MSWTDPVTDWSSFDNWLEYTVGNLFNQRVSLYYRMSDGGARFDSLSELETGLRHADWVFAEPIGQYLAELCADPSAWPDPKKFPPGALSLLQYRMNTTGDWLRSHKVKGRNPIAYPARSHTELLQWLCGPFWEEHGRRLAAESLLLDDEHHDSFERGLIGLPPRGKRPKRNRKRRPAVIDVARRATRADREPDSWSTLADWLEGEAPVFHGFPHVYDILRDHGHSFEEMEAVNATVRSVDDDYDEALRPILVKFGERGKWPSEAIRPDIGALLGLRIEAAAKWARTHGMSEGACIVEYPAGPFRRFLRWLLVNWWDRPGRYVAADQIMLMMAADLNRGSKR